MKTWEELTPAEKEKLDAYVKITKLWQPFYHTLALIMFISIIVGLPLTFTLFKPLAIVGLIIVANAVLLGLVALILLMQDKKRLYLMFGIDGISKDIFDISTKDLVNLKRIYMWKKVK
jgi:hypothetical protein